jgi:ketosteroid isomerase-like protein
VRSIYEALNRGDSDAATHLTDANFEVTFQRGPNAGTHRGRASIQAIVEDQRAAFDAWIIEVERVVERDGQLVAVIKSRLRPRGTDAEFEIRDGHIWTIRDGVALQGFPVPRKPSKPPGCGSRPGFSRVAPGSLCDCVRQKRRQCRPHRPPHHRLRFSSL